MILRWIVMSLECIGLALALIWQVGWLIWALTFMMGVEALGPFLKGYMHHLYSNSVRGTVHWSDWIPKLIVLPFASALAYKGGYQVVWWVTIAYWMSSMQILRRLKAFTDGPKR